MEKPSVKGQFEQRSVIGEQAGEDGFLEEAHLRQVLKRGEYVYLEKRG